MSDRTMHLLGWGVIAVATVAFGWLLTLGTGDLFVSRPFSNVFDLQARSVAHGHLSLPAGSLGFEGFVVGGRTYAYFGVFPSLLRLPVFVLTDRFDGRLTAPSMLLAYVIAVRGFLGMLRGARALARPGSTWSRAGAVVALVTLAVFAVGSNLFFLGSAAWVYHEASLWGAAGVLASFAALISYLVRPRWQAVAAAGAWATIAWLSRGSVGLGPTIALGLIGLDHVFDLGVVRALAPRPPGCLLPVHSDQPADTSETDQAGSRADRLPVSSHRWAWGVALMAAGAVGVLAFASVNTAKFEAPTALPWEKQVGSQAKWSGRTRALAAYHGTLFSARVIPTTVAQSLRPDTVAPTAVFPYLRFTHAEPLHLGQPALDTVETSSGLTVTEPVLLLGTLAGGAVIFGLDRRHRGAADGLRALRPLLIGAVAGSLAPFTIAFIAQRYQVDLVPLFAVTAVAAVASADRRLATGCRPAPRRTVFAVGLALALLGTAATWSTTWTFQRFEVPSTRAERGDALRTQVHVADLVGRRPTLRHGSRLPTDAPPGVVFVIGHCAGLYWSQGDGGWEPIERSATTGLHRVQVPTDRLVAGTDQLLITIGNGPSSLELSVHVDRHRQAVIALRRGASAPVRGESFRLTGDRLVLDFDADRTVPVVEARIDGRSAVSILGAATTSGPVRHGPGVTEEPAPMSTCEALTSP
jgi:hypothetical protein